MKPLELWGGVECTVNRVGDRFSDQLDLTGHHARDADLDLLAELGIAAIRYPVLWERIAPNAPEERNWHWSDARLAGLRARNIRPIVGLIHHGSGPRYTHLLADNFAPGLAGHARAAAERYPWVRDWTPVNEPCTTARFACLYGHWYPHQRDERSFWIALLNQIDATRFSMRAIRAVNPEARLIQTDDLGRTYATVAVREAAAFNNVRRWMAWDLLAGRVRCDHPMWGRLCAFGLADRLRAISDDPCPPDVMGINHYLTSDRFLDHRVRRYPARLQGQNGGPRYSDTEAVRVLDPPPLGIAAVLREAWDRFKIPIAITEVHNGSTREEQMRWMADAWHAAESLRAEGVSVEAVTSWAVFGSSGWNTLLTTEGLYEPGAYDVSTGTPRPTAMVALLKSLANGQSPAHPVLMGEGWWRREIRLHHPTVHRPAPAREHLRQPVPSVTQTVPLLINGAHGPLASALAAACRHRQVAHLVTDLLPLDPAKRSRGADLLDLHRPWAVIDTERWGDVEDGRASEPHLSAGAAEALALACSERGILLVTLSNDPFAGGEGESGQGGADGAHLTVRTAGSRAQLGAPAVAADAETLRYAGLADLCKSVLDLAIDRENGVWQLAEKVDGAAGVPLIRA